MIQLGETGSHLSASRPGGRYHHKRTGGLYIVVPSEALIADDKRYVRGITLYHVMPVYLYSLFFHLELEIIGRPLPCIVGKDHASDIEPSQLKLPHEALDILVIGYPQVSPDLILLDVISIDHDDDLRLLRDLHEHAKLRIGLKPRQYP